MWSYLKTFSPVFLQCTELLTYSRRSTYILKRLHEPKLNPLGCRHPKRLKRITYYYELVQHTLSKKSPTTEVILLKDVPGTGMAGDKIEINRYKGYKNLILPKLAVLATSPEALVDIPEKKESSSVFSKIVENHVSTISVPIFLSYETKWTLEPWHVKMSLRKVGISVSEDCITLPPEKILGPNPEIENRDFLVQLTMNKAEKFHVRCRIFHWSQSDRTLNLKAIDMISPSEPLFPEQKEAVDKLLKNEAEFKKFKKIHSATVQVGGKKKRKVH